jgi:hypothetical protein
MAEQTGSGSQVQLENTTEHVLHIALAGGEVISVPPCEQGAGGTTITFNGADERARFEAALATESVQAWLRDKQLVVHGKGGAFSAQAAQQPGAQPPEAPLDPSTSPTRRGGRGHQE